MDKISVKYPGVNIVGYVAKTDLNSTWGNQHTFFTDGDLKDSPDHEALMKVADHVTLMTEALIPDYSIPTLGIIAYRYWKDKFQCNDFVEPDNVDGNIRRKYDLQPLIFLQDHQSVMRELLGGQPPTPEQVERLAVIFDEPGMSAKRAEVAITNQVVLDQTAQFDLIDLIDGANGPDRHEWLEKCATWIETHGCGLIGK